MQEVVRIQAKAIQAHWQLPQPAHVMPTLPNDLCQQETLREALRQTHGALLHM